VYYKQITTANKGLIWSIVVKLNLRKWVINNCVLDILEFFYNNDLKKLQCM